MRGTAIGCMIVFSIWLILVVKINCHARIEKVCEAVCDQQGRKLYACDQGLFTVKYTCGARKPAPTSLNPR